MNVNITYDNGLAEIAQRIEGSINEIIAAGADAVCDNAKSICPVDTGALRDSISVTTARDRAEISANTDYAAYVEFGTSQMAPQPYLVPSLIGNSGAVLAAMADAIAGIC